MLTLQNPCSIIFLLTLCTTDKEVFVTGKDIFKAGVKIHLYVHHHSDRCHHLHRVFHRTVQQFHPEKKSLDSCIQKLDFAGERFEQILDRIENESLLLTLNQAARYEAAKKGDNSPYEEHMEAASFSSYLVEFLSTQSAVESISYYSWDGSFFYQDNYGAQPLCQNRGAPGGPGGILPFLPKSFWYIHEPAAPYPGGNLTFTCLKKSYAFTGEPLGFLR